ncbi:MAG: divergent polysaccharide deacetylase family protein [Thermodesulfobacteriota bacterium]
MVKKENTSVKSTSKKRAPQKQAPKKKTAGKKSGRSSAGHSSAKTGPGPVKQFVVCVLFVVVCLSIGAGIYLIRHPRAPERLVSDVGPQEKTQKYAKPDFEVFSTKPTPKPDRKSPEKAPAQKRPRVAIIIDDLGYDRDLAEKFLSLDAVVSFAILPYSPHQREIAEMAHRKGCPVMLHMPMEPREFPRVDPGPGAVFSDMSPDERIRVLRQNLGEVPHVCGVNNHMGSAVTADSVQMNQILSILKKRGLFFVDSRTSADSRSRSSARLFQVPFAERDVFLDHVAEAEKVRAQLDALVRMAEKKGQAVGIGHPHAVTYEVLAEMLPAIKKRVKLVPASDVVRVVGS